MPVGDISVIGRNTQGVRLIDLAEGEKVVGLACVAEASESAESSEGGDADGDGGNGSEPPADGE